MLSKKEQLLLFRIRQNGDRKAFAEIFLTHEAAVRRFLSQKFPTVQDAEDAHSVVFQKVWNYLRAAEVEHLSGLIYTIARGVVADFYRTRRETASLETAEASHKDGDGGSGMRSLQVSADLQLVLAAMEKLEERDRQIILLRHFEDLRTDEIADRMGLTVGSARVALHRALEKLRVLIVDRNV